MNSVMNVSRSKIRAPHGALFDSELIVFSYGVVNFELACAPDRRELW